ncbi:MAG TPA: NAD(P)H-hydrate dehydratase, partial [Bacillota bacterium]
GLVHVAVPEPERAIVAQAVPEALTLPLESTASGHIAVGALEALEAAVAPADAVVVGPGLGREDSVELLVTRLLERLPQPVVVDADALNALGPYPQPQRLGVTAGPRILTPHPGEAARLLATTTHQVQADRPRAARELARRTGAVVVLKGAHTLVAHPDGRLWINPTGSPALATGGSGDVLAGTIGALLAQGLAPEAAARAGVFLHGWAGQLLERRFGATGVVAGDIPAALARATRHLRQGAAGARLWAKAGLNVWGEGLGVSTDLC